MTKEREREKYQNFHHKLFARDVSSETKYASLQATSRFGARESAEKARAINAKKGRGRRTPRRINLASAKLPTTRLNLARPPGGANVKKKCAWKHDDGRARSHGALKKRASSPRDEISRIERARTEVAKLIRAIIHAWLNDGHASRANPLACCSHAKPCDRAPLALWHLHVQVQWMSWNVTRNTPRLIKFRASSFLRTGNNFSLFSLYIHGISWILVYVTE